MFKAYVYLGCTILSLTGCQPSQLDKNEFPVETPLSSDHKSNNVKVDNTSSIDNVNPEILRYKVATKTPVFASAKWYGYLDIENNCLVIRYKDTVEPMALALPISDDSSQWQVEWDADKKELIYNNQRFKLGRYLYMGGGGGGNADSFIYKTLACQNYKVLTIFSLNLKE